MSCLRCFIQPFNNVEFFAQQQQSLPSPRRSGEKVRVSADEGSPRGNIPSPTLRAASTASLSPLTRGVGRETPENVESLLSELRHSRNCLNPLIRLRHLLPRCGGGEGLVFFVPASMDAFAQFGQG